MIRAWQYCKILRSEKGKLPRSKICDSLGVSEIAARKALYRLPCAYLEKHTGHYSHIDSRCRFLGQNLEGMSVPNVPFPSWFDPAYFYETHDTIVNLPVAREMFSTRLGNAALDAWNNAWLGGADSTQKIMEIIPGKWDDKILTPVKKAMIWMDPIIEQKEGNTKKLIIIDNPNVEGLLVKVDGKVKKIRVNFETLGLDLKRINNKEISVKQAKREGWKTKKLSGMIKEIHAHLFSDSRHKQLPNLDPKKFNEAWFRSLDEMSPSQIVESLKSRVPRGFLKKRT